jgi:hypothetical protein
VSDIQAQIKELFSRNEAFQKMVDEELDSREKKLASAQKKHQSLRAFHEQIKINIARLVEEAKFYSENDSCPTCAQVIPHDLKLHKHDDVKKRAADMNEGLEKIKKEIVASDKKIADHTASLAKVTSAQNSIRSNSATIRNLQKQIDSLQKKESGGTEDVEKAKAKLLELSEDANTITANSANYHEERTYNEVIAEMLKDSGIKTRIIRKYLPVMNKLINQYLQVLDFYVSFHLDESFSELIKSRHRDAFTYGSFSEGEKKRIDLAILFAWRQIASMKNSISTNLLILDEVFDSSMDGEGTDNLLTILSTLEEGTNVFIISHNHTALLGKFTNTLEFSKSGDFSYCKQIY